MLFRSGQQDKRIADTIKRLQIEMRLAKQETASTKAEVSKATAILAQKTEEQRAARAALLAQQGALAAARDSKQGLLADVRKERHDSEEDLETMQAASAAIAAQIQGAQGGSSGSGDGTPSAGGLIWPVSGPITSGFGWRWGRMHEGVDLAVPNGTPVVAAKAGVVIVAGWMGGYGNLVVVDHGGSISTAYGHNTSVTVGIGQRVEQGQLIAYSGSTGHSTGPHVHFEVRINGGAVDPMGYL